PRARGRGRGRVRADGPAAVRLRAASAGVLPASRQGREPGARAAGGARRQGQQGPRGDAAAVGAPRPGTATGGAAPAARARRGPRRVARRPGAEVPAGGAGIRLAVRVRLAAAVALSADGAPGAAPRLPHTNNLRPQGMTKPAEAPNSALVRTNRFVRRRSFL